MNFTGMVKDICEEIDQKEKAKPCKVSSANNLRNQRQQQSGCPEIVVCDCTGFSALTEDKFDDGGCRKIDFDYVAEKLQELIADPATNDDVFRICRLLYDYLHEVGDWGYRMRHLPATMSILEFLAVKVKDVPAYEIHLDRMLVLCDRPPLLDKSSEILTSLEVLEQYFTVLGYLLAILPTKAHALMIHAALHRLLLEHTPECMAAVKLESRREAMEKSLLPVTVTELVEAANPDMYPTLLELVFLLSSVSDTCCYRMLEAGVLNPVLIRLDLAYATQVWCKSPPDVLLEGESYSEDEMVLIMNVLWSLMRSIMPPKKFCARQKQIPAPKRCAMWGLRYAFKRQVRFSRCGGDSLKMRNEIATFILAGLVALPEWKLTSCGISDDLISLLVATESGIVNVLGENVKFSNTNEDLFFRKILLLAVSYLTEQDACIHIMVKRKVMKAVLELVNPTAEDFEGIWSPAQFWQLVEYAMYAVSRLTPKMPEEFLKYDGTVRLLSIIEWCLNDNFNIDLMMCCTKTICSILKCNDPLILDEFGAYDMTTSFVKLIFYIVDLDKLTLQCQRIVTLVLIIMEALIKGNPVARQLYSDQSIRITMRLLNRCLYRKLDEFKVDQRLLLAIGSYIWKCIVWSPDALTTFVESGGFYMMLDTLEIGTFPVRCLYLGAMADMCEGSLCAPYLCSWRGADKRKGFMSLIAMIWREEEIRLGVRRLADGSVEDAELPLMGAKQWVDTYHAKLIANYSPTLDDMIGSVRSKIYCIRKNMISEAEKFEIVTEHYKKLVDELSLEDRITMACVDLYFRLKIGQIWTEIAKYFEQVGVTPLGMDGQLMFLMIQRHRSWGMFIKKRQRKIAQGFTDVDIVKEKDEFAQIRDAKLAPTLDAFDEIDYIRRTTDESYRLRKVFKQKSEVEACVAFPTYMDTEHYHRTFQDKINATTVFGQHHTIHGVQLDDLGFSKHKLLPVSPSSNGSAELLEVSSQSSLKSYVKTGECVSEERVALYKRIITSESEVEEDEEVQVQI